MLTPLPSCPVSRCIHCRLGIRLCICGSAPELGTLRTKIILVLHSKELKRSSNTGMLLKLSLPCLDVRIHGRIGERSDARQWLDPRGFRPLVMFPSIGARPLTQEFIAEDPRPVALIVPDGTWGQAKHMVKRIDGLADWERVTLPELPPDVLRPRRQVSAERMSTYEAVAQALGILEADAGLEHRMHAFYRLAAAQMLAMRGIGVRD